MGNFLAQVKCTPSFILQGHFLTKEYQSSMMGRIGVDNGDIQLLPQLDGLIPDIVLVRAAMQGDEEVRPDGSRMPIDLAQDSRLSLTVIDIKHTSEANPSYSAEIALYALCLANWLAFNGLDATYYVTSKNYLWTRFKQGQSDFEKALSTTPSLSVNELVESLLADCEDANLRFYLPTVLHFFREDLPRVIKKGDASSSGWGDLEWHVDGRCSACDWLGHEKWANPSDKNKITSFPDHYCYTAAEQLGHLCRIPGMTRGARKTLENNLICTVSLAAQSTPSNCVYQEHSHLKKEAAKIPARAQAIENSSLDIDTSAVLAALAPWPQLHISIAVNFDPSAGILTGLSVVGVATTYTKGLSPKPFRAQGFIVDQKSLDDEWDVLEGFLSHLSDIIEQGEQYVQQNGKNGLTAQVAFWERRQFEELCAAMGRHLPRVLSLASRKTKALAWLFPADEILEKDGATSPCVFFADEIVRRVVFAPTPHVITLFDTSEIYYSGTYPVVVRDSYFREFLTNGIPRERIYEIWSGATIIRRGSKAIPRNTVISDFNEALIKQSRALSSVVSRLREDFRGNLKANAPKLSLSIPQGARNVSFDGKMWVWWDELEYQTGKLDSHIRLALDGISLEAEYEAIRMTNGKPTNIPGEYVFDVLPGSLEAKMEDDQGYLALGSDLLPGLPLNSANSILKSGCSQFSGDPNLLNMPLWSSLTAELRSFDRNNRKARLHIGNWKESSFFDYLVTNSSVSLLNDIFVTKGKSTFNWAEISRAILQEVGNPPIAVADPNAAVAMAKSKIPKPGKSNIVPAAYVLWDAYNLHNTSTVSVASAQKIADYAEMQHGLDSSQTAAVKSAAEKALTIIWGPPGTGKTKTLTSYIHGAVWNANAEGRGINILVSAQTYKAIEELIGRVISELDKTPVCSSDVYVGYSSSRIPTQFVNTNSHLNLRSFNLKPKGATTASCLSALQDPSKVTIVATGCMQAYKLAEWSSNNKVASIFDVVILDESSQIKLTNSLSPLATLKTGGQLIVAGDHMQMPPIQNLEPPKGAEYLVESIQNYLLQRDFGGKINVSALSVNYRSASDIVDYAKTIGYLSSLKAFYPNTSVKLISPLPDQTKFISSNLPWSPLWGEMLVPEKKVLTLLHEDDLSSQSNMFEARIVSGLVWSLRSTVSAKLEGLGVSGHSAPTPEEFWGKSVGIVTPHRAQRALVVRELKKLFPAEQDLIDDAVDTVEKFQGGERHTILVTFGVADADLISGEEAFLMQLERTNVAVSRAMAKCIVIMPTTLAGHVPQDKKALETAFALKGYVDEFCNKSVDGNILDGAEIRQATLRFR
ncbi:DEAD/DEAH box helicase [Maridesulfovibrio sp. FT414]|uniref:DEAD/DEAH box helicase n=1 Tax=Maridesulfovibrio sp. FT414 TaxID=2979469 RepID=UPI003D8093CE